MPRGLKLASDTESLVAGDLVCEKTSRFIVWRIVGFKSRTWNIHAETYSEPVVLDLEICPSGLSAVGRIEIPTSRLRKLTDMEVIAMASR